MSGEKFPYDATRIQRASPGRSFFMIYRRGITVSSNPAKATEVMVPGPVLWVSRNGQYVVIEGPFPRGLSRSADAPTVKTASRRDPGDALFGLLVRPATTKKGRYALTMARLIVETNNEWGEVSL